MHLDINDKTKLFEKMYEIEELFLYSFGKPLSREEWQWFYIDNPVGDPYVSLFYEDGELLGHYAVIPTLLTFRGVPFVAYRSMTTMVHPKVRGRGVFTDLAVRVYTMLRKERASLVYGFPNANSAIGFSRNLGWTLLPPDRVCDFSGDEILKNPELQKALTERSDIEWDCVDEAQSKWRLSIPGFSVEKWKGFAAKEYLGVLNILHIEQRGMNIIKREKNYRALIPSQYFDSCLEKDFIFQYQFGFCIFDEKYRGAEFRRELIMSDVF